MEQLPSATEMPKRASKRRPKQTERWYERSKKLTLFEESKDLVQVLRQTAKAQRHGGSAGACFDARSQTLKD